MHREIPVKGFPIRQAYDSFEAAIAAANTHCMQPQARADSARLKGTHFIDAYWNDANHWLRFSNGRVLHVTVDREVVRWVVMESVVAEDMPACIERVGAQPVLLDWSGTVGKRPMNCSALIASRRGAEFQQLFVNELGLWVYLRGHLILWYMSIQRTDTLESLLYVSESD